MDLWSGTLSSDDGAGMPAVTGNLAGKKLPDI
jgi:hypothetical protein